MKAGGPCLIYTLARFRCTSEMIRLSPARAYILEPASCYELMPLGERVHAVPDPVLGAHRFGGGVEHVLCWNPDRVEFFCQLRDHAAHLIDLGATRVPLATFFHPPARLQDEGVEQDDPEFGARFTAAGEDVPNEKRTIKPYCIIKLRSSVYHWMAEAPEFARFVSIANWRASCFGSGAS